MTYKFTAKVVAGAPGQTVRSLTRALVNEVENITPVATYLTILGGNVQTPDIHLAQTGPLGIMALIILSILSYFGYAFIQKRRYSNLKKEAIKEI